MIDELNKAVADYKTKWEALVTGRTDKAFFEGLKPTSIGWKTEDLAEYNALFNELKDQCDQIFIVWLNERWIAKMHLKDTELEWGLRVVKLMQRRPGSTDATGLDHVDFYTPHGDRIEPALKQEPGLKWNYERSNKFAAWHSVWFEAGEAKLRDNTVMDVCVKELQEMRDEVLAS